MGLFLEMEHQLGLTLSPSMLLLRDILYMDTFELESFLETAAMDNPFLQIDQPSTASLYQRSSEKRFTLENNSYEEKDPLLFIASSDNLDLQTALRIKADFMTMSSVTLSAVHKLITYIEPSGRLEVSLEDISAASGFPLSLLEESLTLIQSMDPIGMGARSLSECLLLQLQHNAPDNLLAHVIVRDHLNELQPNKFQKLAKELSVSVKQIEECFSIIKALDPYPSCVDYKDTPIPYVCEELVTQQTDEGIVPLLRDDLSTRTALDPHYVKLLSDTVESPEQKWMLEKKTAAQTLLDHLQTRNALLLCLTQFLFDHQPEFVRDPKAPLRMLTLSQTSQALGLHISVLSRLVNGKYIRIGHRLVPLRAFFSNGIQVNNNSFTPSQIQTYLQKIIDNEPKNEPYSDETLRSELEKQGIRISRRTVAKYRGELGVPGATKRKLKYNHDV